MDTYHSHWRKQNKIIPSISANVWYNLMLQDEKWLFGRMTSSLGRKNNLLAGFLSNGAPLSPRDPWTRGPPWVIEQCLHKTWNKIPPYISAYIFEPKCIIDHRVAFSTDLFFKIHKWYNYRLKQSCMAVPHASYSWSVEDDLTDVWQDANATE